MFYRQTFNFAKILSCIYLQMFCDRLPEMSDAGQCPGYCCHSLGDHVSAVLELFWDEAEKINKEAEHYPGSLGKEKSAAGERRSGGFAGGRRHVLWRDSSPVSWSINEASNATIISRRDIVFPGELFPDKSQQNKVDNSKKSSVKEKSTIKENNDKEDDDLKPGVMTRW